jgi:hypothetical protein
MKKIFILLTVIVGLLLSSKSFSQQPKVMTTRQMFRFYKAKLNIDSAKAEQVLSIMLKYKENLNQVVTNANLNVEGKSPLIKDLIKEKNRQLEAILTKEEQEKIIPTTEREPEKLLNQQQKN